jgi:acetyl-CoA carboxylase carboxyltransferase component
MMMYLQSIYQTKLPGFKFMKQHEKKIHLRELSENLQTQESFIRLGGGQEGRERQKKLGRLTVRDRLKHLLDQPTSFLEFGIWSAFEMYQEWGGLPAAGVITGIGEVEGRHCMIIANDATVKAGAMFPQSVKKVLRAQTIAYECRLPIIYLVDSSGVFLPLQDEIFPDNDDFGRIFRNNAVLSALGIPQYAAIMGNCIAGGGYLPVLCDKLLMTTGSGLYLAGPSLVKAAIGQVVDTESLGGAKMHAEISGTVDFLEKDDESCIKKLKQLVDVLPKADKKKMCGSKPERDPILLYDYLSADGTKPYDMHDLISCIIDKDSLLEYKADYGKTIITAYAKICGMSVGIVANQRKQTMTGHGEIEIGGVIYADSADKAARFVMDCNQTKVPIIFIQDVMGFMVGKDAEESGIIKSGAKLVSAVSNSIVPKITLIVGHSFGAGNYALCGKAYDPNFTLAWPNATYAVMGSEQAAGTLFTLEERRSKRKSEKFDLEKAEKLKKEVIEKYEKQMDIRYGAARGWVDAIIAPDKTREIIGTLLSIIPMNPDQKRNFHTGVVQV